MSEPIHRLFFALRPDPAVAQEIESAAAAIKASGRVRGRWVQPSKYHLTLHFLGSHAGRPIGLIEAALTAAQRVRAAPFEVELERVETFGARWQFVWFDNFRALLSSPEYQSSIWVTLVFTIIQSAATLFIAVVLAFATDRVFVLP